MKALSRAVCIATLPLFLNTAQIASAAPHAGQERIWTGTNGASFRGVFSRSLDQGSKVEFLSSQGKRVVVAFGNLIESDRKLIEQFENGAVSGKPAFDPEKFKELPVADRNLLPERKDFGGTTNESMVDALWVSLLWWNAFEVMPVPKTGDFDRKAEWLHKELTRYVENRGRSAVSVEEAKEGIEKYFSRRLEDIGACKVSTIRHAITRDPEIMKDVDRKSRILMTPLTLSKLTKGNDIVVIKLSMEYENGDRYVECAAVEWIDPDRSFSMHMYGQRLKGKIEVVPDPKVAKPRPEDLRHEFILTDRHFLPKYYVEQGARFFIHSSSDGLVLKPFVYKTPGEPAPLPGD